MWGIVIGEMTSGSCGSKKDCIKNGGQVLKNNGAPGKTPTPTPTPS